MKNKKKIAFDKLKRTGKKALYARTINLINIIKNKKLYYINPF